MVDIGTSDVMGAVKGDSTAKALFGERDKAINSLRTESDEMKAHAAEARSEIDRSRAELDKATANTGAMTPPKLDPVPTPKPTDIMSQFGSPAMFIAALGSRMTRAPLTASLNASAGVLDAYKKKDAAAAQSQYDVWKANTDNALKLHEFEMDAYKEALSKADRDQNGALAKFQTYAAMFKNDTAMTLAQVGGVDAALQYHQTQERMGIELRNSLPKLQEQNDRMQALAGVTKARDELDKARAFGPDAVAAKTEALSTALQRMRDVNNTYNPSFAASETRAAANPMGAFVAEWRANHGGEDPPAHELARFKEDTSVVRSAPAMAMKKFNQENPNASAEDLMDFAANYRARGAAVQAFSTGKQGDIVRSFNTATEHLDTLKNLAMALQNGDVRAINEAKQAFAKATGSAAPANLEVASQIVGAEVIKAITGTGGGVGERERADQLVGSLKNSPDQAMGAIGTLHELMGGQLKGLERQYEDTTHKKDFDTRLSGAALNALKGSGSGGKKYEVGQVIDRGGKRYRVTGGDPSDPDVEEVK